MKFREKWFLELVCKLWQTASRINDPLLNHFSQEKQNLNKFLLRFFEMFMRLEVKGQAKSISKQIFEANTSGALETPKQ